MFIKVMKVGLAAGIIDDTCNVFYIFGMVV